MDTIITVPTLCLNLIPAAFAYNAKHFLEAAKTCQITKPGSYSPVPYFLYCKGFELAFKALILNKKPNDEGKLKKNLGHDLGKALDEVRNTTGRKLISKQDETTLAALSRHYGNDGKTQRGFEYFTTNIKSSVLRGYSDLPTMEAMDAIASQLIAELELIKFNLNVS